LHVQRLLQRREQLDESVPEGGLERGAVLELFLLEGRDDGLGGGDAAVGLQQRGLELVVQRRVERLAREELGNGGIENIPRAREACLEARRPGKRCYHGCVNSNRWTKPETARPKPGTARGKTAKPGKIRIIAGEYRGRRLEVVDRPGLRPTPDRVRETLFNWLGQSLDGLSCLDLFAGSGALG